MKILKIKDKKQESESWISPAKSFSQDEFLAGIQKAEEGPFHTVQESMENFELWMKSREKR
jgi:predicted transcriptional regulator